MIPSISLRNTGVKSSAHGPSVDDFNFLPVATPRSRGGCFGAFMKPYLRAQLVIQGQIAHFFELRG